MPYRSRSGLPRSGVKLVSCNLAGRRALNFRLRVAHFDEEQGAVGLCFFTDYSQDCVAGIIDFTLQVP